MEYNITLKYYQGGTLTETYETVRVLANEPDLELTFGRNTQWEGVFQEFSGTFIFIKQDRDWIIEKWNLYKSRLDRNTKVTLELFVQNPETTLFESRYNGRLEMKNTSEIPDYVECQFYEDNEVNRISKIQDTEVTIEKDGIAYPYKISNQAAYDATKPSEWGYQEKEYVVQSGSLWGFSDESVYLPLKDVVSEYLDNAFNDLLVINPPIDCEEIIIEEGFGFEFSITAAGYSGSARFVIYAEITYNDGGVEPSPLLIYDSGIVSPSRRPYVNVYKSASDITIPIDPTRIIDTEELKTTVKLAAPNGAVGTVYNYVNGVVSVPTSIYSNVGSFTDDGLIVPTDELYRKDTNIYLNFGDSSKTSQIVANPLREMLDDMETELDVTINTDALAGTPYEYMLLTTDRGVKGIQPLTYNIKFNELFNSMKSFMALSLSGSGSELVIEPIENAYVNTEHEIGEALSLEIVENDLIYNQLNLGNSGGGSSNFDWGDLDFNAKVLYDLGIDSETKKDFSNKVRVDGSTINKAAIDYERITKSIADRDEDKDLYFIAYNGGETDIQSNFTLVSGLDYDKFGQNINNEFCRSRQLWNWRNYLGHLMTGSSEFQLKSWDKNKELVYIDTDRGVQVTDVPDTITAFDYDVSDRGVMFGKNKYIIDIPITTNIRKIIADNPNNLFIFTFEGVEYRGYLMDVTVNPLVNTSGEMTLIEAV